MLEWLSLTLGFVIVVGNPETVTEAEFGAAVAMLTDAGYPVERSSGDAWPVFQEWRAQYSTTTNRLLDTIAAPPARWSGPRSLPTSRHPA